MCGLSHSVVSDSLRPHGLQPTRLLCPEISQARILERVAISFSRGFPNPGIVPGSLASPALAGRFFTTEPPGEPRKNLQYKLVGCWEGDPKYSSCPSKGWVTISHFFVSSSY